MLLRRLNAVLLAVLAYLLSAWFFSFIVFCVASNAGRGDQAILLAAPAMVPMLMVYSPHPFLFLWFMSILGGAVVFFRVLRRWVMGTDQARPPSARPSEVPSSPGAS